MGECDVVTFPTCEMKCDAKFNTPVTQVEMFDSEES